jgi:tryptophanyl-tRNA synthetase
MAADILIHRAHKVPVGKDQEQHLEMARNFAGRFNRLYQTDFFPEPQAFSFGAHLVKVPGLSGSGKMSKSAGEGDCIYLSEDASVLRKKIMKAVTDEGPKERNSPLTEPVSHLFDLMSLVSDAEAISHFKEAYARCDIRYGDMKKQLAEDMEQFIQPHRDAINEMLHNPDKLHKIAKQGAEKARISAINTIREVRNIIGFQNIY